MERGHRRYCRDTGQLGAGIRSPHLLAQGVGGRCALYVGDMSAIAALIDATRDGALAGQDERGQGVGRLRRCGSGDGGHRSRPGPEPPSQSRCTLSPGLNWRRCRTRRADRPPGRFGRAGHRSRRGRPGTTYPRGALERLHRRALSHHGVPHRLVVVAIEEVDVGEHILLPGLPQRVGAIGVNHQTRG